MWPLTGVEYARVAPVCNVEDDELVLVGVADARAVCEPGRAPRLADAIIGEATRLAAVERHHPQVPHVGSPRFGSNERQSVAVRRPRRTAACSAPATRCTLRPSMSAR